MRPLSENSGKPTLSSLAKRLRLSKGTVSLILNNKGNSFSAETRRRVLDAAEEIGYRPDALARALATGKSGFIALWIQNLVTSYYAEIARTMEEVLEQQGYQIVVTPFGRFDENRERYFGTPVGMDGVIAHEIYNDLWPLLFATSSRPVPVVTTGIFAPQESKDHVQVSLNDAVREAIHHLISTGRKRIAYAAEGVYHASGDIRYQLYHRILEENGRQAELIDLPGLDRRQIRTAFQTYLSEKGCPDAIFCHNDDNAIVAYRALCDLKLRVPEDCALVGCDGIPATELLPVPITTIVQPFTQISENAWKFLRRRLDEPDAPCQHITLSATLAIRESSSGS